MQAIEDAGYLKDLQFSSDGRHLKSDQGLFELQRSTKGASLSPVETPQSHISYKDGWVFIGGERKLMIPIDYRPSVTAVCENILAIRLENGPAVFMSFLVNSPHS